MRVHRTNHVVILTAINNFLAKESEAKSTKGWGAWMKSIGKQVQGFKGPLPVKSHKTCLFSWQHFMTTYAKGCPLGSSLKTWCPEFLLGDYHTGTLCQRSTKIPDLNDSRCLGANYIVYINCVYRTVSPSQVRVVGTLLKSTFPDTS